VRLILFGPPGAGKGTQASRLAVNLGIPAISTGEIFRNEVSRGSELGTLAKSYMDAGKYVPDEVVNDMVRVRLAEPDVKVGFLLDGYPRTAAQAQTLQDVLAEAGTPLDAVLEITADTDAVVQRLLRRADLEGRSDDTEPVIRKRMEVYSASATALRDVYSGLGLLVQVDGMGEIDEVTERIMSALAAVSG
jgi:adenylate kinase